MNVIWIAIGGVLVLIGVWVAWKGMSQQPEPLIIPPPDDEPTPSPTEAPETQESPEPTQTLPTPTESPIEGLQPIPEQNITVIPLD